MTPIDWAAFDALVLRSCWDYHLRPVQFRDWLDALDLARVPLHNSTRVARWNMDKTYLRDFDQHGLPIVPTRWLEPGTNVSLGELREETGWSDIVLKPAISATAWQLHRVRPTESQWPATLASGAGDAVFPRATVRRRDHSRRVVARVLRRRVQPRGDQAAA